MAAVLALGSHVPPSLQRQNRMCRDGGTWYSASLEIQGACVPPVFPSMAGKLVPFGA